ncbi:hypothetical protein [Leucothrix arctica]|uniref:EF-hand domain-containing protein n=1 Tax=Leucothrix arctica TaxID=1481894 RepID=A0A317CNG2_9GAMM|nr:hypothetical protein [Leucothrix arctica]PWQ99727.1 hypothetical protein DKT75_00145 [Leucothrix arctica]
MTKYSKCLRPSSWAKSLLSSLVLSAAIVPYASAHLMVAQHGTLNIKDSGVFMVLSVPMSAFDNIDDDGNGKISPTEFAKHRKDIIKEIKEKVALTDNDGARPLQGLLLTPVVPHIVPKAGSKQLVIMGRFTLASKDTATNSSGLTFHVGLFGKGAEEKTLEITATRRLSKEIAAQKHKFELTHERFENKLFAQNVNQ